MLVNVRDLPEERQTEFMELVNFYKTDPVLKKTISYVYYDSMLLGRTLYESYSEFDANRTKKHKNHEFYDFVSMRGDEIIGIMSFYTKTVGSETHGIDCWVWRTTGVRCYTFGKDLITLKALYESKCDICYELIVQTEEVANRISENMYDEYFSMYETDGSFTHSYTDVKCRDGITRPALITMRSGTK